MKSKSAPLLQIFSQLLAATFGILGKKRQGIARAVVSEHLAPVWSQEIGTKGTLRFWAPSYRPLYRGWSTLTKEPDTIAWIDGFAPNSVFWDVGANVGVYSLYAALGTAHRVIAFEPLASNYHVLNRNIDENAFQNRITAYCVALSNRSHIDCLNSRSNAIGSSHHQFAESKNSSGDHFDPIFRQGTIGYSIDDLIAEHGFDVPNYIKIDVDGIEAQIIDGAIRTLSDSRVRSLMVEIQTQRKEDVSTITTTMEKAGMRLRDSRKQNFLFERF